MESKALSEYKIPNYPCKEEVQVQPSLLRKSVYKRWQKLFDLGVSGMLAASLSLSGCTEEAATNPNPTQGGQIATTQNPNSNQTKTVTPQNAAALVAPIFEHGEGRGSIGCMAVSPPAFLSEDEALVVIKEELAKYGVVLNKEKIVRNDIKIVPGTYEYAKKLKELGLKVEDEDIKPEPLEIDLQNSNKNINIEFISQGDYYNLGGEKSMSTVHTYDMKKVAVLVRNKIQADAKQGTYAVFYDPMEALDRSHAGPFSEQGALALSKSNESAKEILRLQVKDFARWLKEQGVIE